MHYHNYKAKDFVNDGSFVGWVLNPKEAKSDYWDHFLEEHPEKRGEVQLAIDLVLKVGQDMDSNGVDEDLHRVWKSLEGKLKEGTQSGNNKRINWFAIPWVQVAAIMIVVTGFSFLIITYQHLSLGDEVSLNESTLIEKSNPRGRKSIITLSDRSRVDLNAESSITYLNNFNSEKREVSLVGEAFFNVTRDENRPFVIKVNGIEVQVLGTSFNIRSFSGDPYIQVAVLTGNVSVAKTDENTEAHMLKENEMVSYNHETGDFTKEVITDKELIFGWKEQKLVFRDLDLISLTKKLSRWYGVEFIFQGAERGDKKITGSFDNVSLMEVMESLSHNYHFEYGINGKIVTIINE